MSLNKLICYSALGVVFFIALHLLSSAAIAQIQEAPNQGGLTFSSPPENVDGVPSVIGASPASASEWPVTFVFQSGTGFCTSTAVGPRVLLTAAHCIQNGAVGRIEIEGASVDVTCDHHPRYAEVYQLDVALCLAEADIPIGEDVDFETINDDPRRPSEMEGITLLGFGCRQEGGGGSSGTLWQGPADVLNVASLDGYYIVTGGDGSAAVCFGDSGGGSYYNTELDRRLFAINSRGNIQSVSYLTPTAHPAVMLFISQWAEEKGVSICGINTDEGRCRI